MAMLDREEHFRCVCHAPEHTLVFDLDKDEESAPRFPELYLQVHLNQHRSIFKRLWVAVKYACGYKCRYGHWDCWILRHEDAERLRSLLDEYISTEEAARLVREKASTKQE